MDGDDGERMAQMDHQRVPEYVGHVERDSAGVLWAVLYCEGQVLRREQVRSLRHGKRRVTDLVLSAADSWTGADPVATMRCPALPEQSQSPEVESIDRAARGRHRPHARGGRTGARFHTS